MSVEQHVDLLIEYREGKPAKEPVHAVDLGNGRFRLLYSPGFVLGIAAGDEFRLLDHDGNFEVVHRSGNIAVQVYSRDFVDPAVQEITRRVAEIGGVLDGKIEKGMVFTLPIKASFAAIEETFNSVVKDYPQMEWFHGNVYDPADGVTPLNWWANAG